MAGRILPVALTTIVGVSIGVATFDGEFKKQRIARLEEEYKRYMLHARAFSSFHSPSFRELAAASASNAAGSSPAATNASAAATPEQLQAHKARAVASAPADNSWSNILGLWAWKQDPKAQAVPVSNKNEDAKGKP
ncbi:hypothetical protein PtrV1_08077 [Pyrenophora tritici-repentis]|uniref:Uncharacterized protein n=1 Tax=Pyrenophora tritici-repentis (strain Pt-1C-BFP) TaxID=426418 RepID=B2W6Z2_PYRTR|nr:uncharacterized protein PTRG_05580 [Pyrenophora tritici-repentis Pt-1C-BFP]EDU48500.1 hypothetical protein PTRG_05580 [Pyrenophora tritici-repentis Pt-1C-BFP]KAA8618648.1 hypothetical protein PtrV1_08077 [Pyrenophora tritici-repentis]KAI1534913.1 hypothetical protein PtrSN001A_006220 [Pyrenophora tritici-repentis]PZD04234.1 hypothetical protein A1F95_00844 [Pyrenophora tritici-repentis]